MNSKNLKKILAFLTLISANSTFAQNTVNENSDKILVKPQENSANKIANYIKFLKNLKSKSGKNFDIEKNNQDLLNMSKDQYFIELVSRIHRRMQIISQDEKTLKQKSIDKNSDDYKELVADSNELKSYINKTYPSFYNTFSLISKDKPSLSKIKNQGSPTNQILLYSNSANTNAAVNAEAYANAVAIANAVAVSNVAGVTNAVVAAEVFVVLAVFII
ncbi:hypothetical protein [Fluviispira sanaruensis]|uniref:Uncharacterized protein n=1 Tax=Fluviispira sanaruensis TaxID=2493639 RepID=A0A4P2VH79_FLUSA|nr:hypothetical protein [Fluviispira sanaruensis]BBH52031.1 hypothetical protein JCM31447_04680 [Fluviispira sanaruensis]